MEPLLFLVFFLAWLFSKKEGPGTDKRGRAFASALEKQHATDIRIAKGVVSGRWGALALRIHLSTEEDTTSFTISEGELPIKAVTLDRTLHPIERMVLRDTRTILIGDEVFDQTFEVDGLPSPVRALFDAPTRTLLVRLAAMGRVSLAAGELQVTLWRMDWNDPKGKDTLSLLRDCAERMTKNRQTVDRLIDNVDSDPEPQVRLHNLRLLLEEHAAFPSLRDTLVRASADADPAVRLTAALELGEQGVDTLRELASSDTRPAAAAITALQEKLPLTRAPDVLRHALENGRIDAAAACIEVLGRHGGPEEVDVLVPLLGGRIDAATMAARALGKLGAPSAETPLVETLRAEDLELRVAVAEALGKIASIGAVLPLKQSSNTHGEPEFHRAVRQAISAIQARVPGEAAGRVSLAGRMGGELSSVETTPGELSLVEKDPQSNS